MTSRRRIEAALGGALLVALALALGGGSGASPIVLVRWLANATEPVAAGAGADVRPWADLEGRLVTVAGHPAALASSTHGPLTTTITGVTTEATPIAAPGAGQSIHVTKILAGNTSDTLTRLDAKEGSGGTVRIAQPLAANGGGYNADFNPPWKLPANVALVVQTSVGVTDVRVNVHWYTAP